MFRFEAQVSSHAQNKNEWQIVRIEHVHYVKCNWNQIFAGTKSSIRSRANSMKLTSFEIEHNIFHTIDYPVKIEREKNAYFKLIRNNRSHLIKLLLIVINHVSALWKYCTFFWLFLVDSSAFWCSHKMTFFMWSYFSF